MMRNSIEGLGLPNQLDRGGYKVHPQPTPSSTQFDIKNRIKENGINQKLILFTRPKHKSGAWIRMGTIQLP